MKAKRTIGCLTTILFLLVVNLPIALSQSSQSFKLIRSGMSSTAGKMSSNSYQLKESAMGVFTSGKASSNSFVLNGVLIITEVEDPEEIPGFPLPKEFFLKQNYPNPFNPTTNIEYALAAAADVKITVYNALGQEVRNINQGRQNAGFYMVQWDGRDTKGVRQPSGLYVYRIVAGDFIRERKMLLLK